MKEIWKVIEWTGGNYEASNLGRVRSVSKVVVKRNGLTYNRASKVLKPANTPQGYKKIAMSVDFKLRTKSVHRVIAETFILNPKNLKTVNHINGIKADNRVINLEWMSARDNIRHAVANGLVSKLHGEQIGNSVAKEWQVIEIRQFVAKMRKEGVINYGRLALCDKYSLTMSCMKDIISGRSWKHVRS